MKLSHIMAAVSAGALLASAATARADALFGDFNILNGASVASGGTVTFTLNGDGTIAATLKDTSGSTIVGFGFDSSGSPPESNFAPTAPDNDFGWTDMYGTQLGGFFCGGCGATESWTIGNPGDYSSVFQALTGGGSSHAFFLIDSNSNQWAADAVAGSGGAVPEPAAWALMLLGFGGLGAALRGRRRMAAAI